MTEPVPQQQIPMTEVGKPPANLPPNSFEIEIPSSSESKRSSRSLCLTGVVTLIFVGLLASAITFGVLYADEANKVNELLDEIESLKSSTLQVANTATSSVTSSTQTPATSKVETTAASTTKASTTTSKRTTTTTTNSGTSTPEATSSKVPTTTIATPSHMLSRINCWPEEDGSGFQGWSVRKTQCERRGCTYDKPEDGINPQVPPCYMDPLKIGYKVTSKCFNCDMEWNVLYAVLEPLSQAKIFDPPIQKLIFQAKIINNQHLQFKILDADNNRFEVPFVAPSHFNVDETSNLTSADFDFTFEEMPFTFKVTRKSSGTVLFDTSLGGFVYSDRFLQLTTKLASPNFYGLGEHVHHSLRHDLNYKTWSMFARDQPSGIAAEFALYGVHPVYTVLEEDGNAHGVFLMNSNAMDYALLPTPAVIMRTIGGIFDFHLYTGPTPEQVVQRHTDFVGRPFIPPYWSLGFHLARWGYNSLDNMKAAIDRTRQYGIPLDAIYADIDHMDQMKDFTIDQENFGNLPTFFETERQQNGLRSVIIIDPAVTENATNYEPWEVLMGNDTFIKFPNGSVMMGYVWPPGKVGFPDFFLDTTAEVWKDLIVRHHQVLPFDGVWIDMNEPSNFGTNVEKPVNWPEGEPAWSLECPTSPYDDPPYRTYGISRFDVPIVRPARISDKTLCMEAIQLNGTYRHYDVHSLYGWSESLPTVKALQAALPGKRGFVLSRSTFAGSGHIVSHWLGDNAATWLDLKRSIIGMLEMSLFGIAHTGPDICGFMLDCKADLCKRWMQLGAFYPFSRNHNMQNTVDQDPGIFGDQVALPSKLYMTHRYFLLPYMYTLFYWAHVRGNTVARPLFHEFPTDSRTWSIDEQFMLGSSIMIAAIVEKDANSTQAYMPKGVWLEKMKTDSKPIDLCSSSGQELEIDDTTYFQRGGSIVVLQQVNSGNIVATKFTRSQPIWLDVLFDCGNKAAGTLFWDDGETLATVENDHFWLLSYEATKTSSVISMNVKIEHSAKDATLGQEVVYNAVNFYGIAKEPETFEIDCPTHQDLKATAVYNSKLSKFTLLIDQNQPTLRDSFTIKIVM